MRCHIRVSVLIPAARDVVWADVANIESHVEWMADAVAIRFTSPTTFECDTRIGPFRTTDRMEILEWVEGSVIGVRHVGLVTGEGRFTLTSEVGGTRFSWDETLRLPQLAAPVLRWVWRRNLRRLRARFV